MTVTNKTEHLKILGFMRASTKEFNTFLTEGHQMFLVEKGEQVKDKTFPVTVNVSKQRPVTK